MCIFEIFNKTLYMEYECPRARDSSQIYWNNLSACLSLIKLPYYITLFPPNSPVGLMKKNYGLKRKERMAPKHSFSARIIVKNCYIISIFHLENKQTNS